MLLFFSRLYLVIVRRIWVGWAIKVRHYDCAGLCRRVFRKPHRKRDRSWCTLWIRNTCFDWQLKNSGRLGKWLLRRIFFWRLGWWRNLLFLYFTRWCCWRLFILWVKAKLRVLFQDRCDRFLVIKSVTRGLPRIRAFKFIDGFCYITADRIFVFSEELLLFASWSVLVWTLKVWHDAWIRAEGSWLIFAVSPGNYVWCVIVYSFLTLLNADVKVGLWLRSQHFFDVALGPRIAWRSLAWSTKFLISIKNCFLDKSLSTLAQFLNLLVRHSCLISYLGGLRFKSWLYLDNFSLVQVLTIWISASSMRLETILLIELLHLYPLVLIPIEACTHSIIALVVVYSIELLVYRCVFNWRCPRH